MRLALPFRSGNHGSRPRQSVPTAASLAAERVPLSDGRTGTGDVAPKEVLMRRILMSLAVGLSALAAPARADDHDGYKEYLKRLKKPQKRQEEFLRKQQKRYEEQWREQQEREEE